jgi:hypothetical protein
MPTFSVATELELREEVATALVNKGAVLAESGRVAEEIAVDDTVLGRFSGRTEPVLRGHVEIARGARRLARSWIRPNSQK